ncbi:hypothetical protein GCM10027035_26090 [Emticicia sediminis]
MAGADSRFYQVDLKKNWPICENISKKVTAENQGEELGFDTLFDSQNRSIKFATILTIDKDSVIRFFLREEQFFQ